MLMMMIMMMMMMISIEQQSKKGMLIIKRLALTVKIDVALSTVTAVLPFTASCVVSL